MVRYLSELKQSIRDKFGIQMVFSMQDTRNLSMKVEFLVL